MTDEFEEIYKRLSYLMIEKLPEYIDKQNKEHNDGIMLEYFTNTSIDEDNLKNPYFKLTFTESIQGRKDRIINARTYKFNCEFSLNAKRTIKPILVARYKEAVWDMLGSDYENFEYWHHYLMYMNRPSGFVFDVYVEN